MTQPLGILKKKIVKLKLNQNMLGVRDMLSRDFLLVSTPLVHLVLSGALLSDFCSQFSSKISHYYTDIIHHMHWKLIMAANLVLSDKADCYVPSPLHLN